jgi:predicted aspartyl protease
MAVNDQRVQSNRVPYAPIAVAADHAAGELAFEALVDTGYTGHVVVPRGSFMNGATPEHRLRLRLADGSTIVARAYRGVLRVGATTLRPVAITEMGDEAIIGMQVVSRFILTIEHGRILSLEP